MTIALLCFAVLGVPPASEGAAWNDFSAWFSRNGKPGSPHEIVSAYSTHLAAQGVAADEVDARAKSVQAYLAAHPREALTLHFNRIFAMDEAPFSREPSALVIKVAQSRQPGRALDIAMGQGRNSLWLARHGWDVSGYDISDEALRQANTAAAREGLQLKTKLASHEEYEYGQSKWDMIVMSFAFTRLSDTAYMQKIRDSLKPGGVLIIEGFNGPPGGRSGGEREPNVILRSFLEYRVLLFEDLPDISDWGKVKAPLLRMAVEKY